MKGSVVPDVHLVKLYAVLQCCSTAQSSTFLGRQLSTDIQQMQAFTAENFRAGCFDYGKNCVCVWMNAWELTWQDFKGFSLCVSNSPLHSVALTVYSYFYSIAIYVLKPNTLLEGLFKEKNQVICNDFGKYGQCIINRIFHLGTIVNKWDWQLCDLWYYT